MGQEREKETMLDNYLWDGSGRPDPEIERLERTLGRFRHNRPAPAFPKIEPRTRRLGWHSAFVLSAWTPRLAAAMLVVLGIGCGLWLSHSSRTLPTARHGWDVEVTPASQQQESGGAGVAGQKGRLELGETLETDIVKTQGNDGLYLIDFPRPN